MSRLQEKRHQPHTKTKEAENSLLKSKIVKKTISQRDKAKKDYHNRHQTKEDKAKVRSEYNKDYWKRNAAEITKRGKGRPRDKAKLQAYNKDYKKRNAAEITKRE
jgi:hypothetical protein